MSRSMLRETELPPLALPSNTAIPLNTEVPPEVVTPLLTVGFDYTFRRIRRRALKNKYGGLIKFAVNIGFRMYNKKVAKTLAKH